MSIKTFCRDLQHHKAWKKLLIITNYPIAPFVVNIPVELFSLISLNKKLIICNNWIFETIRAKICLIKYRTNPFISLDTLEWFCDLRKSGLDGCKDDIIFICVGLLVGLVCIVIWFMIRKRYNEENSPSYRLYYWFGFHINKILNNYCQ